jgi:hypothetical protein
MNENKKEITTIKIADYTGAFAENKDTARKIRLEFIFPAIEKGSNVVLDFLGVDSSTQSFIHALISELIRKRGVDILDVVSFGNCNETIRKIISIVVEYMQHKEKPFPS